MATENPNPRMALTVDEVQDVRDEYIPYNRTFADLSNDYGVSAGTIDKVINRTSPYDFEVNDGQE